MSFNYYIFERVKRSIERWCDLLFFGKRSWRAPLKKCVHYHLCNFLIAESLKRFMIHINITFYISNITFVTLHKYFTLHCSLLFCITLHFRSHCITLITLHCMNTLHCITSIKLHCKIHCIALNVCIALYYIALHITLPQITTIHYITTHIIT